MLTANHGAIGLRSKVRRLFRRKSVIHFGSPFHQEIWSTTRSLRPFSDLNEYSTSSFQPRLYLLRSRSKDVIGDASSPGCSGQQCRADDFHYGHSNNSPRRSSIDPATSRYE